jgi:cyclohexanone monooxygenase
MNGQANGRRYDGHNGPLDAVIVGAGFAGMYMLHRLRRLGFAARVIEAAGGVGGTWYWNRYPGARCDVESVQYSYQFDDALQQEWEWSERYAAQPEILCYANHVADRFDLRRDIQFNTRVMSAAFDETEGRWTIETSDGARISARFCIMATGCLSSPNLPMFDGLERFQGERYHTLRARAKLTMTGIDFDYSDRKALETPPEARTAEYERRWQRGGLSFLGAFQDLMVSQEANDTAAEFVRGRIRDTVKDRQVAELLAPKDTIGCKRLCVDIGYYETFNRSNVELIDVSEEPIEAITAHGVRARGKEHAVDAIVFATGFDAMTGALMSIDIRGRGGLRLQEKWGEGPRTYLGVAMAGFPNLFTITGPGSPSVLTNMLPTIEQHVEWIAGVIDRMRDRQLRQIEPMSTAEDAWVAHVGEAAGRTLRYTCSSWYLGVNIPGKPRVFMPYIGGFPKYVQRCNEIAANGYEGFVLSPSA